MESEELNPLNNTCLLETHTATSLERKVYFAALNIHPVEMDITFRSDVIGYRFKAREDQADDELITDNVAARIPSLSMHVPDLDNAPIRLNALVVEHALHWSWNMHLGAAAYARLDLFKLIQRYHPNADISTKAMDLAAANGHLGMVQYLHVRNHS
ncbi:Aste57867_11990 [Aphanomyces stellatus]|uniref:Aste57867_11990 protein n=1 Tax=Aphanomyces stellatus TaxID=120398 RepID=A0A485KUG5_9STRA|nr:hypothetical protein As57867_011945 [Aphanomyces stellatus]VFT88845.1 Aste57867_11990 [Aphanomyces stellatus]